ncbi:MAG: Winged helix-turn-helix protein, partial [Candidatus Thermoplasmatota archaeon]|nr:Winged helix-turn-helix protein [Candidatus Thermoplasmatota archaeon]
MTEGDGWQGGLSLKAKEKVLVQLYLYRCEPGDVVFPFEITQKGLSEHLGLRRSHVAMALQELVKDGLVVVAKGHVEGEERRQNAYCVTDKGFETGSALRTRLLEVEVSFEDSEGARTVKVSEIVGSRKASLASVIIQLDRGRTVRDEIAVVTAPEKKLISVFCPTCKKQIEVDNVFIDEEVGFDCPGCGRPYRIVPAQRKEEAPEKRMASPEQAREEFTARETPPSASLIAVAVAIVVTLSIVLFTSVFCLMGALVVGAVAGLVVWVVLKAQGKTTPKPGTFAGVGQVPITTTSYSGKTARKPRTFASALMTTAVLAPVLLFVWDLMVASMDVMDTLRTVGACVAAVLIGYVLVKYRLPAFRGDYLLSAGLVLILSAVASMVVFDFGGLTPGMAMAAGIAGSMVVIWSTFHPVDKDAAVLDMGMSVGAFLLLLTALVLAQEASGLMDFFAAASVATVGAVLVYLRAARERTG